MGFIVPLRQELAKLRYEMLQRTGRAPPHAVHPAPPPYDGGGPPYGGPPYGGGPPRGGPYGGGPR